MATPSVDRTNGRRARTKPNGYTVPNDVVDMVDKMRLTQDQKLERAAQLLDRALDAYLPASPNCARDLVELSRIYLAAALR